MSHELDIAAGDRTLYPVDQLTQQTLTKFIGDSAGRVVVHLEHPEATQSEDWFQTVDQLTGCDIQVRRADCGLGCKCAGEVKLA